MNDPVLMANRLLELAEMARTAATDFERAAVFAAAESINSIFRAAEQEEPDLYGGYVLEKLEMARWHICAAVGYDTNNRLDVGMHVTGAMGAASTLISELEKRFPR